LIVIGKDIRGFIFVLVFSLSDSSMMLQRATRQGWMDFGTPFVLLVVLLPGFFL